MSTEQTDADVFEEIDPDPDAVLAEFGVDSPEELVADGGAHDPTTDDEIDVDDTTAAELFDDLEGQATETRALEEWNPDDDAIDVPVEVTDGESPPEFEEFEAAFVGDATVAGREDEGLVESTAAELNAVAERVFRSDETPTDDEAEAPLESELITEAETPTATGSEESTATDEGDSGPVTDARDAARSDVSGSDRTLTFSQTTDGMELVGEPTTTRVESDVFGCAGADEC
ncbi:sugar ABC transporter substrate-binding protein [Haloterrigena salifodinae]|uniref:Sugar ABC transporter substrate-binding protein n=1 Tax=Haloterrigena salifodinae TaxID=2675099 RepID=A0A8T8E6E8_9EURY|nr:sugar ABC transporter substrate-binding protein [Haloterrigena salifodinae]QRV17032.1 sugar ABC transporter substrate-binding protein [Haloterrigena salifodinae]